MNKDNLVKKMAVFLAAMLILIGLMLTVVVAQSNGLWLNTSNGTLQVGSNSRLRLGLTVIGGNRCFNFFGMPVVFSSGVTYQTTHITGDYSMTGVETMMAINTPAAIYNIDAPPASSVIPDRRYTITDETGHLSSQAMVVLPNGADTINGTNAPFTLNGNYKCYEMYRPSTSPGNGWIINTPQGGSTGATGATGSQGPDGPTGATGATGATGLE